MEDDKVLDKLLQTISSACLLYLVIGFFNAILFTENTVNNQVKIQALSRRFKYSRLIRMILVAIVCLLLTGNISEVHILLKNGNLRQ